MKKLLKLPGAGEARLEVQLKIHQGNRLERLADFQGLSNQLKNWKIVQLKKDFRKC